MDFSQRLKELKREKSCTNKTWKATIIFKGHKYYLGSSVDREVAVAIREEAEKQIHGAFLDWYYTAVKGLDNPNGPPAP